MWHNGSGKMHLTKNSIDPHAVRKLLTAHRSEKLVSESISIGTQDFLEKPYIRQTIERPLSRLIEGHE